MKTPKRYTACFALLSLLMLLSACGNAAPDTPPEPPALSVALPDAALHAPASPAPAPETAPEPDAALRDAAAAYVGRPIDELIEAFGEPLDSRYAPSCLGPGQDGELRYEGFTVYTYQQGNAEVVTDVD